MSTAGRTARPMAMTQTGSQVPHLSPTDGRADDNDDSSLIEWKLMARRIETISIRPPFASICTHLLLLFMLAYLQKSGSARPAYSLALKNGADKVDWCRLLSHRWLQDVMGHDGCRVICAWCIFAPDASASDRARTRQWLVILADEH